MGCDYIVSLALGMYVLFQSTHPGWGATGALDVSDFDVVFQSTHPGWGATRKKRAYLRHQKFQSTHPGWGATYRYRTYSAGGVISIHAPRVGCDISRCLRRTAIFYFNPRTPGGVRLAMKFARSPIKSFQSTHPGWGATAVIVLRVIGRDYFNPRTPGGVRRDRR